LFDCASMFIATFGIIFIPVASHTYVLLGLLLL